jgi:DNA polymerase-1
MAFLSYQLATIKVDVPLDIGLDDLQMGAEDPEKLYELYSLLEFKSWLNDLQRDAKRRTERCRRACAARRSVQRANAEAPAVTSKPRTKPSSIRRVSTSGWKN